MKGLIRNLNVTITALLLTFVGQTYASPSPCAECEDACCAPACCGTGFLSADLLYWRAHQEGLGCGCTPDEINNFITSEGNVTSNFRGHHKEQHPKWSPGFRVGAGYEFGGQSWDIAAYWTHFHTSSNQKHQGSDHFHWKLDLDVIDVQLGRSFCMNSLSIRPFIGVRAAQIKQKVKAQSTIAYNTFLDADAFGSSSESFSENATPNFTDTFLSTENDSAKYRAVGPLVGLEADWMLGCNWSVFASASISSLYGHVDTTSRGFNTFLNGTNICNNSGHVYSCQIATDSSLGIRWQHCFCNNMKLAVQLALEQHRYFDHNHLGGYGDLCLDGVSLSFGLGF